MFELLIKAFNIILYQPLFNTLVLLYVYLPGHDLGTAIIFLTIIIRVLFFPLGVQGIRSQMALQRLQPKIKEIQKRFKGDPSERTRQMMDLYRKEKVNPFSGCLPLLVQLPILIALYRVFWKIGPEQLTHLYSFIPHPGEINYLFLGRLNLSQPFWPLAIVTGIFQFLQTKTSFIKRETGISKKTTDFSDIIQKQMLYFFPAFTVLILLRVPSALALYWLVGILFTILQQAFVKKRLSIQDD